MWLQLHRWDASCVAQSSLVPAFRENPHTSYHWQDPCEAWLSSHPGWWAWVYDACCLLLVVVRGLKTQRLPQMQMAGDWRPLLCLPKPVFREDTMAAVASYLGLVSEQTAPVRRQVSDVHLVPKRSCVAVFALVSYKSSVFQLPEFSGMQFMCDCDSSQFRRDDVLVGVFNQSNAQPNWPSRPSSRSKQLFHQWVGCHLPDLDDELGLPILGKSGVIMQKTGVQDQSGAVAKTSAQRRVCSLRQHSCGAQAPLGSSEPPGSCPAFSSAILVQSQFLVRITSCVAQFLSQRDSGESPRVPERAVLAGGQDPRDPRDESFR
eukprot:s4919_g3.t1